METMTQAPPLMRTTTPRGEVARMAYREGTTDLSTIFATFSPWGGKPEDEYGLAEFHPRRFLDIGAHIGAVTVAVLLDNPECQAVCIEPLPENVELLERNLTTNGVWDRATIIPAAVGTGRLSRIGYGLGHADELHRFIGSTVEFDYDGEAVTVTNADAVDGTFDLVKLDCEGCEWTALGWSAVQTAPVIVGEWHSAHRSRVATMLPDHDVTVRETDGGAFGTFRAVRR